MSHVICIGPTLCGKTTLGFHLCRGMEAAGIRTLSCDPHGNPWPSSWRTRDRDALIVKAKQSRGCGIFIDEAGQSIARDDEAEWLFVASRNWGHKVFVFGHAARQFLPVMREQCSTLYLFRVSRKNAEVWAEEFADERILRATTLEQFQFIKAVRFREPEICRLRLSKT